jgi:hypothetical protein
MSRIRFGVFTTLSLALPLVALGLIAVQSAHASTSPETTGTTKQTLPDGGVVWCVGSPGYGYPPTAYANDLTPDGTANPANLPPGWEKDGNLWNGELGQDALTTVSSASGGDTDDVYAIQLNYWDSVTTGEITSGTPGNNPTGVPSDGGGTTTPGAIGYSTGSSCMLYYPGGANAGLFEITYPAFPSTTQPAEMQWFPGPATPTQPVGALPNPALWNAFPLNGNPQFFYGSTDGGPTGYVSTWKGCSWDNNSCTPGSAVIPLATAGVAPISSDWNVFPEMLSNISSIPTMWSIAFDSNYGNPGQLDTAANPNPQHPVWDASYDIWFDKSGTTGVGVAPYGSVRGQNDGLEIMVWLNSKNSYVDDVGATGNTVGYPIPNVTGYAQPSGMPREQVLINNVVYDVWTSRLDNAYYGYSTASNPNAATEPNYAVVKGGAEGYTCPTLAVYNTTGTTTNGTNANPYSCGTEWNVVSFVATQSNNSGTMVDYRGTAMTMDSKVFTDYILGINDGLWAEVTPPFATYSSNRSGAVTGTTIGVLQCPGSAMSNQQDKPVDSPSACLNENWLLTSIQAGFEPWEGGNGLESTAFQAHVMTTGTAVQSGLTAQQGQNQALPVVNWETPFQVVFPGCASTTTPGAFYAPSSVNYLINGTNSQTGAAMTYPLDGTPASMSQVTGTPGFEAEIPGLFPMHSNLTTPTVITFTADCDGTTVTASDQFWIDPSGQIFYSDGKTPVQGATVTLEYSPSLSASGPFVAVPNQNYGLTTDVMDPHDNTLNSMISTQYGVYAWDVIPGYYTVTATKSGCGTVTSPVQHVTTTPITNLYLDLPCAAPPAPKLVAASLPAEPAALTAAAASTSQINLSWGAVPPPLNATSVTYTVYEVTPTATTIASGVTASNYQVTGLNAGTAYSFAVTAVDAGGASTKSTSASATTQGSASGNCHITYTVTSAKPGIAAGLTVNINIQNTGKTAIYPWTLGWTFPGNQKITYSWNVTETQTGEAVTMKSIATWESIAAGATLTGDVGFNGNFTGTNTNPTAFTLNGLACQ